MRRIASYLPGWVKRPMRQLRALPYYGVGRSCVVCSRSSRAFRAYGVPARHDAQCAHCGALERHRLVWLYLSRMTDLFDGAYKRMLHVAPEPCLEPRFRARLGRGYLTADLADRGAMVRLDLTAIPCADDSFDVIYCSHVLEHIPDDKKAMQEVFRVVKSTGWAILLVPITTDRTYEDSSLVTASDRLKAFGQEDHVRRYGRDYIDRLRAAGFVVTTTSVSDLVDHDEAVRLGLTSHAGDVYHCYKA